MTEPAQPPAAVPPSTPRPLSGVALVAAVVVLVAFGAFVAFLASRSGAGEVAWTRLAWLFASVEAVAFGAAGALFGSSIQRQRAEAAEASAAANAGAAARGRALADAIKADTPPELESLGPATDSVAARHAAIARALFP